MSKSEKIGPYKYDDDEDYVPTKKVKYSENENLSNVQKKHTLDSDEEEDDVKTTKKYNTLQDEDIDGQEEGTVDFEGETVIMPFNMKEEMEDGHFDKDGFYHFKKDSDQLKDAWLDNIDWVKVKRKEGDENKYGSESEESLEGDLPGDKDERKKKSLISIYCEIIELMKEGETVAKSLKRHGGNQKRLSSAERWKLKKAGKEVKQQSMEEFMKMTDLANKVIETGNMDVYQETYEMINLKIQRSKTVAPTNEPSMDMFSNTTGEQSEVDRADKDKIDTFDAVRWEFRWMNEDDAEIHGPFDTSKMIKWKESGYFKDGVHVRKRSNKEEPWYHSARVEFDLYN